MSSANSENAPFPPDMPHEEEPEQVLELEPKEESKEEPMGDAEGANSDTNSGEIVPYSIAYGEDTCSEEALPFESARDWGIQEVGTTEPTIPPNTERSEPQPDLEAQLIKSTNEDSDVVMEALDDRLVQIQGVVDVADSALGRLHGRVAMGETRLTALEHEVIAAEQRNERVGEHLDSFGALTIVNTMLLAFVLLEDGSLRFTIQPIVGGLCPLNI
ncbi:hypothetical protein L1987_06865 [Smallanthus sonchifolius]|uniref:Uncharacterized protein n=1 Tax=Smallanthus sonchifolius TaxID=185202 RepID=A0ACB9JZE7_9ASTR|nr:hypothetical protein L1987_06865 [Smallanthus sonchifolius]